MCLGKLPHFLQTASDVHGAFRSHSAQSSAAYSENLPRTQNIFYLLKISFVINLRFVTATYNASFAISSLNALNLKLSTIGFEAVAIYKITEHWRGYAGVAFSGINDRTFSVGTSSSGNSERELSQANLLIFSPLVGFGYDIPLAERSSTEGRVILTPEVTGLIGMNNLVNGLRPDEHWLLTQVRVGVTLHYEFPRPLLSESLPPQMPSLPQTPPSNSGRKRQD
jgi:hypothetical protein